MTDKNIQQSIVPITGMAQDYEPLKHPEDKLTYALNVLDDSKRGTYGSLTNEHGNSLHFGVIEDYKIIGVEVIDDEQVVFSTNGTNSEIGIYNGVSYTAIINSTCFNFDRPIISTHRVIRGCERVIYWVDGENPDRWMNIDELTYHYLPGTTTFDCSTTELNRNILQPGLSVSTTVGSLPPNNYSFAIKFEDLQGTTIGYTKYTTSYNINENRAIEVNFNFGTTTIPRFRLIVYTNKQAYQSDVLSTTVDTYYLNSIDQLSPISLEETIIPTEEYEASSYVLQVDNRLVRANVEEKQRDYTALFNHALSLTSQVTYQVKEVAADLHDQGLMRDEIVPLGIVYEYDDGHLSPAFHIPGLDCDTTVPTCSSVAIPALTVNTTDTDSDTFNNSYEVTGTLPAGTYNIILQVSGSGDPAAKINTVISDGVTPFTTNFFYSTSSDNSFRIEINVLQAGCTYTRTSQIYSPSAGGSITTTPTTLTATAIVDELNTSTKDSSPRAGFASSGIPGCYKCTNNNYINENCVDWGALANTSIRHWRMPDIDLEPLFNYSNNTKRVLGIAVNVASYPSSDIVGHYIVYGKDEPSIIEKGLIGRTYEFTDTDPNSSQLSYKGVTNLFGGTSTSHFFYQSNDSLINNNIQYAGNIKHHGNYNVNTVNTQCLEYDGQGNAIFGSEVDTVIAVREFEGRSFTPWNDLVSVDRFNYLYPKESRLVDGETLINGSQINSGTVIELTSDINLTQADQIGYVSLRRERNSYCTLNNIVYYKCHDNTLSPGNNALFPKDVYISDINYSNGLLTEIGTGVIGILTKIVVMAAIATAAVALTIVTGGAGAAIGATAAAALSQVVIAAGSALLAKFGKDLGAAISKKYADLIQNENLETLLSDGNAKGSFGTCKAVPPAFSSTTTFFQYVGENLSKVYTESRYNMEFRGNEFGDEFIDFYGGDSTFIGYMANKFLYYESDSDGTNSEKPSPNPVPVPEVYIYNDNWLDNEPSPFFAYTDNECSDCKESFPNRIIYSQVSLYEDLPDMYRVTLANNFVDIPQHRGEIVALQYKDNDLYIHTEDATFIQRPNPQRIQTDKDTAYIGTGDFLSIVPVELNESDNGNGGMQCPLAHVASPYGYMWVDQKRGKIYQKQGSMNIISDKDMRRFFRENLPSTLETKYKEVTGNKYPKSNKIEELGTYVTATYDPENYRYLITKRDYDLVFPYTLVGEYNPALIYSSNSVAFNTSTNQFVFGISNTPIPFNDTYFEDKSFTISYSIKNQSWYSFHSYLPDYSYNDSNRFFSVTGASSYVHGEITITEFFEEPKDHIIEFVVRDLNSIRPYSLAWIGYAYSDDAISETLSFDRMWVYNDRMSTGIVALAFNGSNYYQDVVSWNNVQARLTNNQGMVKVSQIRDLVINANNPIATNAWASIQSSYPIDKVPDSTNHETNRNMYVLPTLNARWVKARLYFTSGTHNLHTELIIPKSKINIR